MNTSTGSAAFDAALEGGREMKLKFRETGYAPKLRKTSAIEKLYVIDVANQFTAPFHAADERNQPLQGWVPDKGFPDAVSIQMYYPLCGDFGFDLVFGVSEDDEVVVFVRRDDHPLDPGFVPYWGRIER